MPVPPDPDRAVAQGPLVPPLKHLRIDRREGRLPLQDAQKVIYGQVDHGLAR